MKRVLVGVGAVYLLFAVIGRFVEAMGAVRCDCAADCWCKKPGLSTFRWVAPFGHRLAAAAADVAPPSATR
jgi:hypothetical protein